MREDTLEFVRAGLLEIRAELAKIRALIGEMRTPPLASKQKQIFGQVFPKQRADEEDNPEASSSVMLRELSE
jgi:hypothetical protein